MSEGKNVAQHVVDFSDIPLSERARRYRELAGEAQQTASHLPNGDLRNGWLKIASDWTELAEEIEQALEEDRKGNDTMNGGHWLGARFS